MTSGSEARKTKAISWWPLLAIVVFIILAWWFTPPLTDWMMSGRDFKNRGVFGDTFGAVNALFSGLAFAGLFYAILLQRAELEAQREELADTHEVLKSQRVEAERQNATLLQQTFDNTFFQLLRLHNDIVMAIDIVRKDRPDLKGRDCFRFFYEQLQKKFNQKTATLPNNSMKQIIARIEASYIPFYDFHEKDLGHYYRSVYNLIKFVDLSTINDKHFYTNLVRAQLSSFELKLLCYNCSSKFGVEKFKPLVEKYSLLKHLDFKDALHGENDRKLFTDGAYGR
jgi:hypothetical protein